ncbi:hypothetical protein EJ110_NYTH18802 [Nymphaea thermarum]|nr:hypothetical protein EJ110_NYTH18802 [Nymphaea thermarum]
MLTCKINSTSSILRTHPSKTILEKHRSHVSFSCSAYGKSSEQPRTAKTDSQPSNDESCSIKFQSLNSCSLGIARYPDFAYNAEGGTGTATGRRTSTGKILATFDITTLYIPPLEAATTRFLGLPLPPFLKIEIVPRVFTGEIEEETGKVNFKFKAEFFFSVGSLYRAPPLIVDTVLTSEESKGRIRFGKGGRLNKEGRCMLVGVATVDPINDSFMNTFLGLPTECIANLNANIFIS